MGTSARYLPHQLPIGPSCSFLYIFQINEPHIVLTFIQIDIDVRLCPPSLATRIQLQPLWFSEYALDFNHTGKFVIILSSFGAERAKN